MTAAITSAKRTQRLLLAAALLFTFSVSVSGIVCIVTCDVVYAYCGQEVTFRVACPFLPGQPVADFLSMYKWTVTNHQDSSEQFSNVQELVHVFDSPGTYFVRAYATDLAGTQVPIPAFEIIVYAASDIGLPDVPIVPTESAVTSYEDDFSDTSRGWPDTSDDEYQRGIEGGLFKIAVMKGSWSTWSWVPQGTFSLTDFVAEVDVSLASGSDGYAGIIWGVDNDNFRVFYIDEEGRYRVRMQEDDEWLLSLVAWTSHPAIHDAPASNHLTLTVKDDSVILAVNDVHLKTLAASGYQEGRIGLYVGSSSEDEPYSEGRFDNLSIYPVQDNIPPIAAFSFSKSVYVANKVFFSATTSVDPDGAITSYAWDFGDGEIDTGATPTHSYSQGRTYTVTLTVRDNDGDEDTATQQVVISNRLPWAAFGFSPTDPVEGPVHFDASESYDVDGTIVSYNWEYGDEQTGTGKMPTHTYTEAGTYLAKLTVTDDDGATFSRSKFVTIADGNDPPVALFTWHAANDGTRLAVEPRVGEALRFDAGESYDPDGEIVEYAWDWNDDGTYDDTSGDPLADHWFEEASEHTVVLRVIDDQGATDTHTEEVVILAQQPPRAAFAFTPDAPLVSRSVTFDANASNDPDGEITQYAWDFDNDDLFEEMTALPTIEHTFTAPGTHTVTLQVTDNNGASADHEELVTVRAAPEIIEPQEVWALVIGISDYQDVKELRYARADAEAFTRWLLDSGVDPNHIVLLLDEETDHPDLSGLTSELATLVKVRAGLGWLRRMADPDDLVFFYFAGHGWPGIDDDGDEEDGVDEFLVLYDTLNAAKEETAMRDDEFGQFLDKVQSNHVMVVFDSCYSGGQSRSLSSSTRPLPGSFDLFNDFSLDGKLILAAAQEDQEALENEGLGHGVFTHFLLLGLQGAADLDGDYLITADELSRYVAEQVETFAWSEEAHRQIPEMTGRGEVGIVLGHTNRPPEASFVIAPEIPYAYGVTTFTDNSTDDAEIVSWAWDFGDGTSSTKQLPTHIYEDEAAYTVTLTVTDDEGETVSSEQQLIIAQPGEVTTVAEGTIIISLGSGNGVQVGDRFEVVRVLELSSGQRIVERKATLEVAEILGVGRAACQIEEQWLPIDVRDLTYRVEWRSLQGMRG